MLRIFRIEEINPLLNSSHAHFLPFDLERSKYEYTQDIDQADIVPVVGHPHQPTPEQRDFLEGLLTDKHLLLILSIFHIDDGSDIDESHKKYLENFSDLADNIAILHTNMENKNQIFYDALWNRQKAYCLDYDKYDLKQRVWTWSATRRMYIIPKIQKTKKELHYLSPSRVYYDFPDHPRTKARIKLKEVLTEGMNNMKGYRSDPTKGKVLSPQENLYHFTNNLQNGGTWWPVANINYRKTFASIYTETITTTGETRAITEKTWDPLIKGHFIIPFGYSGLINDIKKYGFKLPDWIDYGYDLIVDDNQRLDAWLTVVREYLNMDVEKLNELHNKDFDMLIHNQNVFKERPYDSLYDKLNSILEKKH